MSNSVVVALTNFGRTLEDSSVEARTKLHVLGTLNEVSLTLNELSESGVGRSVNKLKSEPGELGTTARLLITKWKRLLHEHLAKQSIPVPKSHCESDCATPVIASPIRAKSEEKVEMPAAIKTKSSKANEVSTASRPQETRHSDKVSSKSKHLSPLTGKHSLPINESHSAAKITTATSVKKLSRKRKSSELPESLDSTCGLSFMESLNVPSSVHRSARRKKSKSARSLILPDPKTLQSAPIKLTPGFTQEVLSALNEDFDRPDIIHRPNKQTVPTVLPDLDDGDLKFKSKKILWVPKSSRSAASTLTHVAGSGDQSGSDSTVTYTPQSLVDLCLDTLERNLNRVDHVGNVPYELIGRVLQHASAEDLARIEHCNPQFTGCNDGLWLRHIQRKFATLQSHPSPRPGETWLELYERLVREETDRLNRIINQSTRRMQEEQKSHRTTITTEAIMPRDVRRRIGRHTGSAPPPHHTSKRISPTPPVFKPYNVSHPTPTRPVTQSTDTPRPPDSHSTSSGTGTRGLLDKLRKQFAHARRLR